MAKEAAEETSETDTGKRRTPLTMLGPAAVLTAAAIAVGLVGMVGGLGPVVEAAAVRFTDQAGYKATVLHGAHVTHPVALYAAEPAGVTVNAVLASAGSAAGALVLAWLVLGLACLGGGFALIAG
jgi:hypothetical protein